MSNERPGGGPPLGQEFTAGHFHSNTQGTECLLSVKHIDVPGNTAKPLRLMDRMMQMVTDHPVKCDTFGFYSVAALWLYVGPEPRNKREPGQRVFGVDHVFGKNKVEKDLQYKDNQRDFITQKHLQIKSQHT